MKRKLITIVPLVVGIIFVLAYNLIGASVLPDGTLVEPFWLLPVGYLLIGIGIVGILLRWKSK